METILKAVERNDNFVENKLNFFIFTFNKKRIGSVREDFLFLFERDKQTFLLDKEKKTVEFTEDFLLEYPTEAEKTEKLGEIITFWRENFAKDKVKTLLGWRNEKYTVFDHLHSPLFQK